MFHKHLWYFAKWLVSEWPAVIKVCKPLQQNGLEHTASLVSMLPASKNQVPQCNFIRLYRTAMYGNKAGCCGRKLQFVGRLKCWGAGRWQDNGMQGYIAFRSTHVLSGAHWSGIRKTKTKKKKKTIKDTSACELGLSPLSIILMCVEVISFIENILNLQRNSFFK